MKRLVASGHSKFHVASECADGRCHPDVAGRRIARHGGRDRRTRNLP
jgi:hypothetical protein